MSWAAAMRLGMAEGDAMALAGQVGALQGHLINSKIGKFAEDGMVQVLLEEAEAVFAGARQPFFMTEEGKEARADFRKRYYNQVSGRVESGPIDKWKRHLSEADLNNAELRDLASAVESDHKKRGAPASATPLEAARAALAISQATSYGGLAVEHVMIEEMGQVLAGNPGAAHFSSRANRDDRNALRKQVARNAEAVKAMPSDEQDRVIARFASEIRGSGKRPAASQ